MYEKAEQNNYTNGSGHFLVFICVSVQKKRLFGLSRQNRYSKEQSRTKKASQRDLCVCVSEYPPNKNTALVNVKKSKSQNEQKRPELFVILVPHICTYVECTERYVRMVETFCHKVGM